MAAWCTQNKETVVWLVICFHFRQGLINSPHVVQWRARLEDERARGSIGGAVARRLLALSSSQPLVCVFPKIHGSCPTHFVWQTHPRCLMAWRTRRPRVDLAVILQGRDRLDGASSASARPPKAPRTTSVTAAIPGTSPRTPAVPGSTATDAQPLELPPLRQDSPGRRAFARRQVLALRQPHERQAALRVFDEACAASSRGIQARAGTLQRLLAPWQVPLLPHRTRFACWAPEGGRLPLGAVSRHRCAARREGQVLGSPVVRARSCMRGIGAPNKVAGHPKRLHNCLRPRL